MELWTNRQVVRGKGNVGRKNNNRSKICKIIIINKLCEETKVNKTPGGAASKLHSA
jgi:uncharacterized protein (UPF0333 family)